MATTPPLHRLGGTKRAVLFAVHAFVVEHGYCPTVRDLMGILGLASESTVWTHLWDLRNRYGVVTWEDKLTRTLRLTDAGRAIVTRDE